MRKRSLWDSAIHAPPDTPSIFHLSHGSALRSWNKSSDFGTKIQILKPHVGPYFGIFLVLSLFHSNSCYLLAPFVANTMLVKPSNHSGGRYCDLSPFFCKEIEAQKGNGLTQHFSYSRRGNLRPGLSAARARTKLHILPPGKKKVPTRVRTRGG